MCKRLTTKKQRKRLLKELGLTKEDMNLLWNELIEINDNVNLIHRQGKTWKDLSAYSIFKLPTLKNK